MGVPEEIRSFRIIKFMERQKQGDRQHDICLTVSDEEAGVLVI
jgi:hypothetical protein